MSLNRRSFIGSMLGLMVASKELLFAKEAPSIIVPNTVDLIRDGMMRDQNFRVLLYTTDHAMPVYGMRKFTKVLDGNRMMLTFEPFEAHRTIHVKKLVVVNDKDQILPMRWGRDSCDLLSGDSLTVTTTLVLGTYEDPTPIILT